MEPRGPKPIAQHLYALKVLPRISLRTPRDKLASSQIVRSVASTPHVPPEVLHGAYKCFRLSIVVFDRPPSASARPSAHHPPHIPGRPSSARGAHRIPQPPMHRGVGLPPVTLRRFPTPRTP